MSESLSNEQLAAHVNNPNNYGASVGFSSREHVKGKGFMTAFDGAEKPTQLPIKAADIADYRQAHHELASSHSGAVHGIWKNPETPGVADQDLSVQVKTPKDAQSMGIAEKQKASFALPKTRVSNRGHNVTGSLDEEGKPTGGDVLLHTADLGKNDTDPRYRPGALDTPGEGSFTRNQYKNKDWNKTAGTLNGKPVKYEQVLRTINENRVARMRGE
jgi:hypothetical protein